LWVSKDLRKFYELRAVERNANICSWASNEIRFSWISKRIVTDSHDLILEAISWEIARKLNALICQMQIGCLLLLYKIPFDKAKLNNGKSCGTCAHCSSRTLVLTFTFIVQWTRWSDWNFSISRNVNYVKLHMI